MTQCQHCTRKTQLPLCTPCTHQLADMLTELPWLLHQLDITVTRQDHLNTPGNGHTTCDQNPINVGAMELARQTSASLHQIALDVAEIHASERIPALVNATPSRVAHWLKNNLSAIQNHPNAGEHYHTISTLVGDTKPGPLVNAINRPDTHFAGPCPTIRGYDRNGAPIACNTMLYAHDDDTHTTCDRCGSSIDIAANRRRTITLRDLLPAQVILEVLENLGEPLRPQTFYGWISPANYARKDSSPPAAGRNAAYAPQTHASIPSPGSGNYGNATPELHVN